MPCGMRTTVTFDADVASLLKRVMHTRKARLKDVVNEALRAGLPRLETPPRKKATFRTPTADLGGCLLPSLDCLGEVLEIAEGPGHR